MQPTSSFVEQRLSFGVLFSLLGMPLVVEFDGETSFDAAEVKHEGSNGMLPTELHPVQTTPAECRPQQILSPSLPSSQVTSGRHIVAMTRSRSPWHGTSVAQLVSVPFFTFSNWSARSRVRSPLSRLDGRGGWG